ncbi:type A2 lantipeptide [Streptomyces sp. NPDC054796]
MDFTPQVETREISDSDLDNVSGGVLGPVVGDVVGTVDSVAPVSEVTGTVSQVTGVNTSAVTGLAGL